MQAETRSAPLFRFDNSYASMPERFYARLDPTPVAAPGLVRVNEALARQLGIDAAALMSEEGVAVLAGNCVPEGAVPIAMAYAGHQFGGFSPQLGDGRAILLGEVIDRDGGRFDIQLKGSGPTPFSRRGDGRAAVGPVLREYIVAEAMAALGIPTTRALAAVVTGETVWREAGLPGAVLTRVASSHIRVGTFQYFAARGDSEALRLLADYVIERHYPDAADAANPYRALLDSVIGRQMRLVAQWMGIGFIHGVMNTDNMAISGETIDYGPCAFMDTYHPATVFSSIDRGGRYAYANQPRLARWNLARFAETLLPLLGDDETSALAQAQPAIDSAQGIYEEALADVFRRKLGLTTAQIGDLELANALLDCMAAGEADFTLTFRALAGVADGSGSDMQLAGLFKGGSNLEAWLAAWRRRLAAEGEDPGLRAQTMRVANPAVIPRNHLVEQALAAAAMGDLGPFEALLGVLARPHQDLAGGSRYAAPPQQHEVVQQTFCGT